MTVFKQGFRAGLISLWLWCLIAAFSPLWAEPVSSAVVLTLGEHPESALRITWQAPVTDGIGYVEVFGQGATPVPVGRYYARGVVLKTDSDLRQVYSADLTGLKPGSTYPYRVVSEGNGAPRGGTFRTAPGTGGFTFLHITDTQGLGASHYRLWGTTLRAALLKYPDASFLLHTGDFVDSGNRIGQWDQWSDAAAVELGSLPLVPVVGNHEAVNGDGSNPVFRQFLGRFSPLGTGDSGTAQGTVRSFDYGEAHIAVLNTECGAAQLEAQAEWLKRDMAATDKKWRIVALHRGPYSAMNNTVDIREAWVPAFEAADIDLVLSGHDHSYVRTVPWKAGKPSADGVVYITGNSGGYKFYPRRNRVWQAVHSQPYRQMYAGITVTTDSITVSSFTVKSVLVDEVVLRK